MKISSLLMVGVLTAQLPLLAAESEHAKAVERQFGRLSADGASAFDDIHMARLAIFDGKTDEAAKLVSDARSSLQRAKTDEAGFVKAEAAFHRPPHIRLAAPPSQAAIAWIPIDGEITVGAGFLPSPEQGAAVVTARKGLAKGDAGAALHAIREAALDVTYTMAVAPLEPSIAAVERAGSLMQSHDYYAASQILREAEASIRYDQIDDVALIADRAAAHDK